MLNLGFEQIKFIVVERDFNERLLSSINQIISGGDFFEPNQHFAEMIQHLRNIDSKVGQLRAYMDPIPEFTLKIVSYSRENLIERFLFALDEDLEPELFEGKLDAQKNKSHSIEFYQRLNIFNKMNHRNASNFGSCDVVFLKNFSQQRERLEYVTYLLAEIDEKNQDLLRLKSECNEILESRTWKLTRPVRCVSGMVRRFFAR
jgi:hypothetical protein